MDKQTKRKEPVPSGAVPRESDNPIIEEFKEELIHRPTFGTRPAISSDEERLSRLEGLMAELHQKIAALERKVEALEMRR